MTTTKIPMKWDLFLSYFLLVLLSYKEPLTIYLNENGLGPQSSAQTSSIGLITTCVLVWNANSWAPLQTCWIPNSRQYGATPCFNKPARWFSCILSLRIIGQCHIPFENARVTLPFQKIILHINCLLKALSTSAVKETWKHGSPGGLRQGTGPSVAGCCLLGDITSGCRDQICFSFKHCRKNYF